MRCIVQAAVCLLLGFDALTFVPREASAQAPAHLYLSVRDAVTGDPIPGAKVEVRNPRTGVVVQLITNTSGRAEHSFTLEAYEVHISHEGYEPKSATLDLRQTETQIDFALAVRPFPIDSVEVKAPSRPYLNGFWERRQRNIGYFFTREDIERAKPVRVADLFRRIPGAKVVHGPNGLGQLVAFDRLRIPNAGVCPAAVYLDGQPFVMSAAGLDDFTPDGIEALEAYSGASRLPPQFNATGKPGVQTRCGVIVIWSRRGRSN